MAKLTVAHDAVELANLAAERIAQLIDDATTARGSAFVSLTGGTTPRGLYANLADRRLPWRARVSWSHLHLFWGDERHVPPDHPDSNYGMARATLLDHVPIPSGQVHRIRGELPNARAAAADYERTLETVAASRGTRLFDVMLLGLGEDAHIASIFPGSEVLEHRDVPHRVTAVWVSHLDAWRITLTPDTILDSRALVVLVSGAGKAAAVRAALHEPLDTQAYPAQLLRAANERMEWFLDRAACPEELESILKT